jgi:hypothetical protein
MSHLEESGLLAQMVKVEPRNASWEGHFVHASG